MLLWAMPILVAASPARGDDVDPTAAIEDLAHIDPGVRARAAAALRRAPLPDEPGESYWRERAGGIAVGMTRADVEAILPPAEPASGITSFGATTAHWRLDAYWTVTVTFAPDGTVLGSPALERGARAVWVAPPDGFSGTWVTWFVTGEKAHEIAYRDGAYDGVFRSYHDSGGLAVEQHYAAGVADGRDTGFYRGGARAYEGTYAAGKRDGVWTHWYEDGQLHTRGGYEAGEPQGVHSAWFPDGRPQSEIHYDRGVRHGLDKTWDEAGNLLWEREYADGVLLP